MKFKKILKILWFCLFCVGLYYLYIYINILKVEYTNRENKKRELIEKIDLIYKEREIDFYKKNKGV